MPTVKTPPTAKGPGVSPNVRQQVFIEEYLKDLNGTRAAMRAGYTQNPAAAQVQASRLLTKPDVRKAVARLVKAKLDRLDFKAEEVLEVIVKRIRHDIRDMFEDDCNVTPLKLMTKDEAMPIAGYEIILKNAEAGDGHIDKVLKVKLEERAKYVEMAAKYFGLLVERVELSGDDDLIAALHAGRDRVRQFNEERRKQEKQDGKA